LNTIGLVSYPHGIECALFDQPKLVTESAQ
jgi:hypothetical protein